MPIYEFYCSGCHTIYNFFSRRIDTSTVPDCPGDSTHALIKQASMFTYAKHTANEGVDGADPFEDMSPTQMEQVLTGMANEFSDLNEEDPKQMARLMRRLVDSAGVTTSEGLEEAISRMESGEDPDQIEDDLGAVLDGEDPFTPKSASTSLASENASLAALRRRFLPPKVDETLHDLTP